MSAWAKRHSRIMDVLEQTIAAEERVFNRWMAASGAGRYRESRLLIQRFARLKDRERLLWRAARACYPTLEACSGLISRATAEALAATSLVGHE